MRDASAAAPGRVNLIGEHTDYNGGFVLPMPIPQQAYVEIRARGGDEIRATSREFPDAPARYRLGRERRSSSWLDYVMGCTAALREAGYELEGCELHVASDVPLGSGLSSSAALEVAVLRGLRSACGLQLDDVELALLGQRAENDLVGAPVGAMDQLASSLGVAGEALFLDMRSLEARRVVLPSSIEVVVIASGVRHDLAAGSGYRTRRGECEEAARLLGVLQLRELTVGDLPRLGSLPAPLDRRVRHVITENARVLATVAALAADDRGALGELFAASHASMRDDYEVSIREIDAVVEIATSIPGIIGARLTGGGFGGSIVALASAGSGRVAARRIVEAYRERVGGAPQILLAGPP